MLTMDDRDIIHGLAMQAAAIAALPVQEEKRKLWRKLNTLNPERPMVMIDQVCWREFNAAQVRSDLIHTRKVCEKHGCPLEFILKDLSTIN